MVIGQLAVGRGLAHLGAGGAAGEDRHAELHPHRAVLVPLVLGGYRIAFRIVVGGDEIQGRPVPGLGPLHFLLGDIQAAVTGDDGGVVGPRVVDPVLQGRRLQRRCRELGAQGGHLPRQHAEQFLQQAPRHQQVVLGLDQLGLGQVAPGGGLVDIDDGAITQLEAPLGRQHLFVQCLELDPGQLDGLQGQQYREVAAGQADRRLLGLDVEHRIAEQGTLLALAVLRHALLVEQRLAQLHHRTLGVVFQVAFHAAAEDIVLFTGAVHALPVGRAVDVRQQPGLAQLLVLLPGLALMHRRQVSGALGLISVPGFIEVHGGHGQGYGSEETGYSHPGSHVTAP
ncbi:hypothetical protein D9M71_409070 [compost metagenome]